MKIGLPNGGDEFDIPDLPEEVVGKLNQFNQYFEANLEFAGAPFKFEGEEYPLDDSLGNFIENLFDQSEGMRLKLTANMPKGLIKMMNQLAGEN